MMNDGYRFVFLEFWEQKHVTNTVFILKKGLSKPQFRYKPMRKMSEVSKSKLGFET